MVFCLTGNPSLSIMATLQTHTRCPPASTSSCSPAPSLTRRCARAAAAWLSAALPEPNIAAALSPTPTASAVTSSSQNSGLQESHQDQVDAQQPSHLKQPSITVYYRTSWHQAWLHGSLGGGAWKDYPLSKVPSAPGVWLVSKIDCGGNGAGLSNGSVSLEFVATNRQLWDKPMSGGNYRIDGPGTYRIIDGVVSPVAGEPVLVVSDLDGTMVGDDAATAAFKAFWEDTGVTRGGVLAYNTGRSLDSFTQLLREKKHCLAHPDILISAVGTQIYTFDGQNWHLDKTYEALLDQGWKIDTVREAGYKALSMVGREKMHFRPADEQNAHKITCGVHISVLPAVLESISSSLETGGVKANLITSGTGDWRFLDIVSLKAGKLEALTYVRNKFGFPVESAVACGDSGNDILMLSGKNPAIVVSNAQPDLRTWVEEQEAAGTVHSSDDRRRVLVTRSPEAYGILEGLEYFGFK